MPQIIQMPSNNDCNYANQNKQTLTTTVDGDIQLFQMENNPNGHRREDSTLSQIFLAAATVAEEELNNNNNSNSSNAAASSDGNKKRHRRLFSSSGSLPGFAHRRYNSRGQRPKNTSSTHERADSALDLLADVTDELQAYHSREKTHRANKLEAVSESPSHRYARSVSSSKQLLGSLDASGSALLMSLLPTNTKQSFSGESSSVRPHKYPSTEEKSQLPSIPASTIARAPPQSSLPVKKQNNDQHLRNNSLFPLACDDSRRNNKLGVSPIITDSILLETNNSAAEKNDVSKGPVMPINEGPVKVKAHPSNGSSVSFHPSIAMFQSNGGSGYTFPMVPHHRVASSTASMFNPHHRLSSSTARFCQELDASIESVAGAEFLKNMAAQNMAINEQDADYVRLQAPPHVPSSTIGAYTMGYQAATMLTGQFIPQMATPMPLHVASLKTTKAESSALSDKSPKSETVTTKKRARRKCNVEGCANRVVQGGLCIAHGAKRKTCSVPGCDKNVKKAGLCSAHGPARKKCEHPDCDKVAVQGGVCIAHGARKKICNFEGCAKQAILSGMCKKHHDRVNGIVKDTKKKSTSPNASINTLDISDGSLCAPVAKEVKTEAILEGPSHTRREPIVHNTADIFSQAVSLDGTTKNAPPKKGQHKRAPTVNFDIPIGSSSESTKKGHHKRGLSIFFDENVSDTIATSDIII